MEVLVGLSVLIAAIVGGVGLIVFLRRRQAGQKSLRSAELRALDERIAARVAGLRPDGNGVEEPRPAWPDDEVADLAIPMPALLPVEGERSWRRRLGLGGEPGAAVGRSERGTVVRDTAVVLVVGALLLLVGSQVLPASIRPPNPTATPTPTTTDLTGLLPTGTPNFLVSTPSPTLAPGETPTPTLDITYLPTPTPIPTLYIPPPTPGTVCSFSSFSISPTYTTAGAGSYRTYSTTYADTCGRAFTVTSYSTFVISGGTCSLSSCKSSVAGSHTVTATYGSHHAYATQVVTALPTPTPIPTPKPTPIPTASPTATPTASPTPTATPVPTPTPCVPGTIASVVLGLSPSSIPADGTSTSTATATVTDTCGGAVTGVGVSITTNGDVTISGVTDHGNGTYTATITASLTADSETITASAGGHSDIATLTET